ncbi:MAG: helix-turn-helix transcriptional regulator [Clostridia bacterium]|nr:helix-turn-helix transcriptional regulator [Clostridia bacterium]
MQSYWEIIRELREDHDLTQADVAAVLGTTQQVYSRYEKGINEMPIRHLITLCQYYHVSADYILGLSKKMK